MTTASPSSRSTTLTGSRDMDTYAISVGQSREAVQWPVKSTTWERLTGRLSKCKRTPETVAEYKALKTVQKGKVKDIGGFVGGTVRDGGRRKGDAIVSRSLVTLDIDFGQADTLDIIRDMMDGTAWCVYSTHSHTPETPRLRLVVPLSREVTPDEYVPIARRVADDIGIDLFDDSTYEPPRLMYWPSCPKDGEFVFEEGKGSPLDADKTLATYTDWRNVVEWPVSSRVLKIARGGHGARQEDPTTKPGMVGAFCRTYGIAEAIETHLSDIYEPAGRDRYTYLQGSTAGGMVVYEDKWAYSHHGTDPCCEKLVNAFDLVRIHKFGALDQDADINTPVNRLPSYLAMVKMAERDKRVSATLAKDVMRSAQDDFAEEVEDWIGQLETDKKGGYLASPTNFGRILRNDKGLKDAVALNSFDGRKALLTDLPWRKKGVDPYWNDADNAGLIEYVCEHYGGLTGKTTLLDASDLVFTQRSFHPVRDYLNGLKWDGVARLDTMLTDYLGAEDSPLTRAMARKHFAAAVARVMQPGAKYDYVLTLIGPEGCGKSTLVKTMAGEWFSDSITNIDGKEAMEQLKGKWLIEMGELTNYKRSTSDAYKAFISKQDDSYRKAYGRESGVYLRQCVFFATTNEANFLKGDTGNRRFWVVECMTVAPTKNVWEDLPDERDQIWAEAVVRWRNGEQLFLGREMEAEIRKRQEKHNEVTADERVGIVEEFIHKPLPLTWDLLTAVQRRDFFRQSQGLTPDEPSRRRETICAVEIHAECFGLALDDKTRYKTKDINYILRLLEHKGVVKYAGRARDSVYGLQHRYTILEDVI